MKYIGADCLGLRGQDCPPPIHDWSMCFRPTITQTLSAIHVPARRNSNLPPYSSQALTEFMQKHRKVSAERIVSRYATRHRPTVLHIGHGMRALASRECAPCLDANWRRQSVQMQRCWHASNLQVAAEFIHTQHSSVSYSVCSRERKVSNMPGKSTT